MESKKINFFSRIKKAIMKFDDYEFFINEKLSISIAYMMKLILVISIIVTLALSYAVTTQLQKIYSNVLNDIPNFNFAEYQINAEEVKEHIDDENALYFAIDTTELLKEQTDNYLDKMKDYKIGILILKDKMVYKGNDVIELSYKDLITKYNIENITFSKDDAIKYIDENVMNYKLYAIIFITLFITFFLSTVISVISDIILLWLLGIITSRLAKLKLGHKALLIIAIYSLTLSILLLALYNVVSTLTSFRIDYFNIIYISIAYIYVIAAILMIKSDMIKQNIELTKIVEVQEKVKEELEDDNQEEKDKDEENKPEDKEKEKKDDDGVDLNDGEPDGSGI